MHAPQRPGRCARAQAQERRDREVADADAMQAQYGAAWAGAEATHAQGRQLLDDLTRARPARAAAPGLAGAVACLPGHLVAGEPAVCTSTTGDLAVVRTWKAAFCLCACATA